MLTCPRLPCCRVCGSLCDRQRTESGRLIYLKLKTTLPRHLLPLCGNLNEKRPGQRRVRTYLALFARANNTVGDVKFTPKSEFCILHIPVISGGLHILQGIRQLDALRSEGGKDIFFQPGALRHAVQWNLSSHDSLEEESTMSGRTARR